jgi:UDP-N-acetylmuramyl pentapeptide phosphotransferase/UDP-N-acetylglucosamine-1-phosphate transferase
MIIVDKVFYIYAITFFISTVIIYIFNKNNILIDKISSSKHKNLQENTKNLPPLCGGLIILICSVLFFKDFFIVTLFGLFFLVIGIFSDTNKISSPLIRILSQFIISFLFVILSSSNIFDLRVDILNYFLEIKIISILFTVFCILILINGSNFLDGLNTLVLGYYILTCIILIYVSNNFNLNVNPNISLLIISLFVLYIFNFFGKVYLGDSGAYLIGFFISFFVIEFSLKNTLVSPYFICFLLWYPAFENLFSILRRMTSKSRIDSADKQHLHHLIYGYFLQKNLIKSVYINSLVSNLINFYNLVIFVLFSKFYLSTQFLITGILLNVSVYLFLFFFLKKRVIKI